MIMFQDPYAFLLFDIPLFLVSFGAIFVLVSVFVKHVDPVMNTAIAALAAGAALIIVRSQAAIQQWIYFNPNLMWALAILVFALIVIKWILHV